MMKQREGMALVPKPVRRVEAETGVREATTGRVVCMRPEGQRRPKIELLPRVWAVAEPPRAEVAFYRKYTEAMLRRYVRLALQSGRVPSLLGRELFRGNVTHYQVRGFDDVVIFCFDMEKLLERLEPMQQQMVKRIGMQEYTRAETASMMRMSERHCFRVYDSAIDRLTEMLLEAKMLNAAESCQ